MGLLNTLLDVVVLAFGGLLAATGIGRILWSLLPGNPTLRGVELAKRATGGIAGLSMTLLPFLPDESSTHAIAAVVVGIAIFTTAYLEVVSHRRRAKPNTVSPAATQ